MKRKTLLGLAIMMVTLVTILAGTFITQASSPPGAFVEHNFGCYTLYPFPDGEEIWTYNTQQSHTPNGNSQMICQFFNTGLNLAKAEVYKNFVCHMWVWNGSDYDVVDATDSHMVFSPGGTATLVCGYKAKDLP